MLSKSKAATAVAAGSDQQTTVTRTSHTQARPLTHIDLDKPGRLRVGHMMTLFSVSHSTLYSHIRAGRIPKPDGDDGARPYWRTETVKQALKG